MVEAMKGNIPMVNALEKPHWGKTHWLTFTDHASSFDSLPGCSVVEHFLLFFHIHLCFLLIFSKQVILAVCGGSRTG